MYNIKLVSIIKLGNVKEKKLSGLKFWFFKFVFIIKFGGVVIKVNILLIKVV